MNNYWIRFFTTKSTLAQYLVENKDNLSFRLNQSNMESIRSIYISKFCLYVLQVFLLLSAGQAIIEYFDLNQNWLFLAIPLLWDVSKYTLIDKLQYAALTAAVVFGQYIAVCVFSGEFGTSSFQYFGFKFNNLMLVLYLAFLVYMRHYVAVLAITVNDALQSAKKVVKIKGFNRE